MPQVPTKPSRPGGHLFQFSSLLNEAWMMTMTPTNIVSGFRKCRVHPFNANAITAATIPTATTAEVQPETKESDNEPSFTADEETRFRTRYEERCDIFTPRYKLWLSIHHPQVISDGSVANAQNSDTSFLMDHFQSITPEDPLDFDVPSFPAVSSSTSDQPQPRSPAAASSTASDQPKPHSPAATSSTASGRPKPTPTAVTASSPGGQQKHPNNPSGSEQVTTPSGTPPRYPSYVTPPPHTPSPLLPPGTQKDPPSTVSPSNPEGHPTSPSQQ